MAANSLDGGVFACDCVANKIFAKIPGCTSLSIGVIPYRCVYDSQDRVRSRGYWIPGIPVTAKISNVEKDQKFGLHLLNAYLYTIELEHGPFRWSVVKRNKDFSVLSARLLTHRAAEIIRAPVRRAAEVLDEAFDYVDSNKGPELAPPCSVNCNQSIFTVQVHVLSPASDIESDLRAEIEGRLTFSSASSQNKSTESETELTHSIAEQIRLPSSEKKTASIKHHGLPYLGIVPDSVGDPSNRKEKLESWLQAVLHIPINRNHHETAEFLEVSRYSFVNDLGGKCCEGFVKKRPGGGRVFIGWKQFCDSSVCYMNPRAEEIRLVLLFDRDFTVSAGLDVVDGLPSGLILSNQQHELELKCSSPLDAEKWKLAILESMNGVGKIWREPHSYGSSFPVRHSQFVQWFIDGRSFMEHAANMMELATEEIFITDWWLSPEIYLKRPLVEGNRWRLDQILKRKAEGGVRIFILLYKEMEMALGINSIYTKRTLQNLHENIKVLRHPDHYLSSGTFFWAHHEKLIIIDQLVAFVGGIDLCYGRWDDQRHVLTDLGSVNYAASHAANSCKDFSVAHGMRSLVAASSMLSPLGLEEDEEVHEAKDASVCGVYDLDSAEQVNGLRKEAMDVLPIPMKSHESSAENLSTSSYGKLHNVIVNSKESSSLKRKSRARKREKIFSSFIASNLTNKTEKKSSSNVLPIGKIYMDVEKMDLTDAVIKYKKYVASGKAMEAKKKAEKYETRIISRVKRNFRPGKKRWQDIRQETSKFDIKFLELKDQDDKIKNMNLEGASKLWLGKDYANFIQKDFIDLELPFHDFIDRGITPRMPWHDIHAVTYGSSARDMARHFIQRWNATKTEKSKELKRYPYLLPKCYDSIKVPRVITGVCETADVQVLRSVSKWSTLINYTEDSIQQAYLSLIANSRHYVYIENQFFVSLIGNGEVCNEICRVICDRIKRAYHDNEDFRVYILIPLLPGFEGDVGTPGGSALAAVLNWAYLSLSRGPNSLFENLKKHIPDPAKFISVASLRTYDRLCGKLITELIYIHSKLMIVDDKYVIIGSANVNDRSQLGNRDSEVCILVKDTQFITSRMNGKSYQAGKFAFGLRKQLMTEHFGMLPEQKRRSNKAMIDIDMDDPVIDSFFTDTWIATAKRNTKIYEDVFRIYPNDHIHSFEQLKSWEVKMPMCECSPQLAEEQLRNLVGNLVEFPMNFLQEENLAPGFACKEGLIPNSVFT